VTTEVMSDSRSERRAWNLAVWVAQACLASILATDGVMRLWLPLDRLQARLAWPDPGSEWWVRFSGFALVCAASALLLPPLMHMATRLVPATAIFMVLVMIVAFASHAIRGRAKLLAVDVLLAALCVFVAWGRTVKVPHRP
jgi:hypothetical protein